MPERRWYLTKDGVTRGPFNLAKLRELVAAGTLCPEDPLREEDTAERITARRVPGLFRSPPPLTGASLLSCAKCAGKVSDEAEMCPHCGQRQPAAEAKEPGKRGAKCATCGTFNLVSDGFGKFSDAKCRGCGRPLRETNPDEFLDAEMERVYANSVEYSSALPFLWALGLSFVLYCTGVLPRAQNGNPSLIAFYFMCGILYFAFRALTRRYIRWLGARLDMHLPSELAHRMRGRSWDRVAARYAESRNPGSTGTTARTAPTAKSLWSMVAVLVVVVIAGYYFYEAEFSQYALGRKAGVQHVREMSAKGPIIRAGMNIANVIDLIPNNANATPDWNAGFRAGFKEELERMYPQAKK